ncbi:MAG: response regulator [Pseudanabaenales cyanobacterium]|nr:response regulator [Pseudanabaenales cyanobacterium]
MKRILVIEDETQVRENIQQILEFSDFEVISAAEGNSGLKLAKIHTPDLIICDIMMPGMDGYGVLKALRQELTTETIPVIFLTAKADRADLRQGMELGADDYLTKPFENSELLRAVKSRLERQSVLQQHTIDISQQAQQLKQDLLTQQQSTEEHQKLADIRGEMLGKVIHDLREPLSNINMIIHMLKNADSDQERDRYLNVLKEEYTREINLLNQLESLQTLLTPENAKLLQNFNLLKS